MTVPSVPAKPPLVVLSGPSGVGKTTVVERLTEVAGLPLRRAVTATTRAPRPGEVDGVHYHFWQREKFEHALATGQMLEHAVVHGHDYYGTPRSEVDPHRANGVGVLLVIDVQGAEQVRRQYPGDCVSVFLAPPTFEDLSLRLAGRGDHEASVKKRLETAAREMARAGEFDHRIVNATLDDAARDLERIIRGCFPAQPRGD